MAKSTGKGTQSNTEGDAPTSTANTANVSPQGAPTPKASRKALTPEEVAARKAKHDAKCKDFKIGLVQQLAAGPPGEYLDTGCEHGLGLRVGKSRKAVYFVRFQYGGHNRNITLGCVPGTPNAGKALPPMQLKEARAAAQMERARIENPAQIAPVITLRAAFADFVENKEVLRRGVFVHHSASSKRQYYDVFERYCAHIAERSYTSMDWLFWRGIRDEGLTGLRDGKAILSKAKVKEGHTARPLTGSKDQVRVLFMALRGMYKYNRVPNPIIELMEVKGFASSPPRSNTVEVPELPALFAAFRALLSPIASDFYIITALTGWRRTAILQMERAALDCDALTYRAIPTMEGWKRAPAMTYPLCQWLVKNVLLPRAASYKAGPFLFPCRPRTDGEKEDKRSPSLIGPINALERTFGRRIIPTDVRRLFVSIAGWIGIDDKNVAKLTGRAVSKVVEHAVDEDEEPPEDTPEESGERMMRTHYRQIALPVLRNDVEDIAGAILQCAGEMPIGELVRAKLKRDYPAHLAYLDTLAINVGSKRRALAAHEPQPA